MGQCTADPAAQSSSHLSQAQLMPFLEPAKLAGAGILTGPHCLLFPDPSEHSSGFPIWSALLLLPCKIGFHQEMPQRVLLPTGYTQKPQIPTYIPIVNEVDSMSTPQQRQNASRTVASRLTQPLKIHRTVSSGKYTSLSCRQIGINHEYVNFGSFHISCIVLISMHTGKPEHKLTIQKITHIRNSPSCRIQEEAECLASYGVKNLRVIT